MIKILIANRGEIAVRIIRTCKEMGIGTIAVYSDVDRESLHVEMADESYCIGGKSSKESYLNIQSIVELAELKGANYIHPGYGFLSENTKFRNLCEEKGIGFIGPTAELMNNMGNKSLAKIIMKEAGVPVVPGSKSYYEHESDLAKKESIKIGYPLLIKASAGGGGKGMRVVNTEKDFENKFFEASREATNSFQNGELYLEKLIVNPKHIEIQILADKHGNVIHLGERDCSIQRRHQKLLEETPSPRLTPELRREMGKISVNAAKKIGYLGLGTIEYLLSEDNKFYFMEMNTRVQVEHPITEEITGIDIIKEQINIALGKNLSLTQEEVQFKGHAIECRINAEDSMRNYVPSPGVIERYIEPGGRGVRIDSFVYNGYKVQPFYDSLISKLIIHGSDREDAIRKLKRALDEYKIEGIQTTIPFYKKLINNNIFLKGTYNTNYIEENENEL